LSFVWSPYASLGSGINVVGGYGNWLNAGTTFYTSGSTIDISMDGVATTVATPALTAGRVYTVLAFSVGAAAHFYLNGSYLGAASKSTPLEDSSCRFYAGGDSGNIFRTFDGVTLGAAFGVCTLGHAQAASLSRNLWQLFEPRRFLLPTVAPSLAPVLSLPTVTSITATGATPRVTATF
jgi:hypothetical protein